MDPFFENLRILLVDDEHFIRQLIAKQLRYMGVKEILTAKSGEEAFGLLSANVGCIDLMILDLKMPNINGLNVLEAIRTGRIESDRDLPIIVLTGHAEKKALKTSVNLGVHGFLAKPVSANDLEKRIKSALRSGPVDPRKAET